MMSLGLKGIEAVSAGSGACVQPVRFLARSGQQTRNAATVPQDFEDDDGATGRQATGAELPSVSRGARASPQLLARLQPGLAARRRRRTALSRRAGEWRRVQRAGGDRQLRV